MDLLNVTYGILGGICLILILVLIFRREKD